ncbi:MAG: hypothetical protein FD125_1035 [bacterium]|nr:MAG: hypothetical protein FD125_1035 [bacterium]
MPEAEDRIAALADKTLLVLDDDNALRTRLGRALSPPRWPRRSRP